MAKKAFGKLAALLTVAGAAAAGISYLKKYRSFHKELDEDFHDFEDEDDTEGVFDSTMTRNYVSLHADKDEFLVAATDMVSAAKDAASAAKNMVKDAAAIVADNTREAVSAAKDSAQKASIVSEDLAEKAEDIVEDVVEKAEDAAEDAVIQAADIMENAACTVADITAKSEPTEITPPDDSKTEDSCATTVSDDTEI